MSHFMRLKDLNLSSDNAPLCKPLPRRAFAVLIAQTFHGEVVLSITSPWQCLVL
jgi:hypothetical protein